MSNINKVFATYNGQEFECKIGETYEFSDNREFKKFLTHKLLGLNTTSDYIFSVGGAGYRFIRPVQKKELSAEELYRICGKKGYEVQFTGFSGFYGIINSCDNKAVWVADEKVYVSNVTHYRKAYSTEDWQPIEKIERE